MVIMYHQINRMILIKFNFTIVGQEKPEGVSRNFLGLHLYKFPELINFYPFKV
jgi:hypothetical protein